MVYSNKRVFKVGGILLHEFPLFRDTQENKQRQARKREEKKYEECRQEQPKQRELEYEPQYLSLASRGSGNDSNANYNGTQIIEPETQQASHSESDSTYPADRDIYDVDSDSDSCQNNVDEIVSSKGCFLTVQTLEIPVLSQDGVIVDKAQKEFVLNKYQ